jgi:hypothetical protein
LLNRSGLGASVHEHLLDALFLCLPRAAGIVQPGGNFGATRVNRQPADAKSAPPLLRTNRTRRVLHPVLIGHAVSRSADCPSATWGGDPAAGPTGPGADARSVRSSGVASRLNRGWIPSGAHLHQWGLAVLALGVNVSPFRDKRAHHLRGGQRSFQSLMHMPGLLQRALGRCRHLSSQETARVARNANGCGCDASRRRGTARAMSSVARGKGTRGGHNTSSCPRNAARQSGVSPLLFFSSTGDPALSRICARCAPGHAAGHARCRVRLDRGFRLQRSTAGLTSFNDLPLVAARVTRRHIVHRV